jgi:hypothetical protein
MLMANSIFQNDMMSQYAMFKKDPVQFLISRKINIPQEYLNNPKGAVEYLMNSGQMSQDQLSQIEAMASKLGIK